MRHLGVTRPASRVFVFKWKTLETCCVTPKYCLVFTTYTLNHYCLFIQRQYAMQVLLLCFIYIYIYITYVYVYICILRMYIHIHICHIYIQTYIYIYIYIYLYNALVPFDPFIPHPLSKFTLRPWNVIFPGYNCLVRWNLNQTHLLASTGSYNLLI